MASPGGGSGVIHASANAGPGGAAGAGNPRKFAEKIQILNIKGAEETSEFEKIMQECAAVRAGHQPESGPHPTDTIKNTTMQIKGTSYAAQAPVQVRAPSPVNSGFQNIYAGGQVTSTGIRNHLSAAPFNSIVHRHGSMPNMAPLQGSNNTGNVTTKLPVGDLPTMLKQYNMTNSPSIQTATTTEMNLQQGNYEAIARISEIISMSSVPSISTSTCTTMPDGNHVSRKHPPVNQQQTPQQQQYHNNNRTRLNTTPSASTRPNSNCPGSGLSGSSNSPGPIRHKSRRHETSPFERKPAAVEGCVGDGGNRRESGGSTGSGISAQHLSPPDLSVRRFYSDPSLHQTVNGVQQPTSSQEQSTPGSDICGSQTIVPTQFNETINQNIGFRPSLPGITALQNASPTISRRVAGDFPDTGQIPVGSVQNAYVQMLNRGSGTKPASSDGQAQMLRDIPVTGQISYLPLPHVISGVAGGSGDNLTVASNTGAFISNDGRPSGSLPDLTNFHVNSHSPSPGPGATLAGESSNETCVNLTATVCSPNYSPDGGQSKMNMNSNENAKLALGRFLDNKDAQKQQQILQLSSNSTISDNTDRARLSTNTLNQTVIKQETPSPTLTYQHPNTANSVVRLSDNEISEILSLPIALVSDDPYSASQAALSGSVASSNVATSTTTSNSSIISPNSEHSQLQNIIGFGNKPIEPSSSHDGQGEPQGSGFSVNDVFVNKNNNNNNHIKTEPLCDNNALDFLNPLQTMPNSNKGIDMDQSDGGMMNEDFQSSLFGASGTINFEGVSSNEQQHFAANKLNDGLSAYRNSQYIPEAHSPASNLQCGGSSPFGARSTSPIDISSLTGSPHHSPNLRCNQLPSIGSVESVGSIPRAGTNGFPPGTYGSGGSPGYSSDMMISAGGTGSAATQMDLGLSKEFQRFTVTEPGSSQQHVYFPSSPAQQQVHHMTQHHSFDQYQQQPLHDWMNGGSQRHGAADGAAGATDTGNVQQNAPMPSPNPQTPSSIPDILISRCGDENTTDQTLQRLIALGEFDNDPMFSDELRADLGKLDDNMIRLLEDNVQMDQNIADAVTEEHLKM